MVKTRRSNYRVVALFLPWVASLIPFICAAQEYLEPERGVFSVGNAGYQNRLREVFTEGYRHDVLLKVIILDAYSTESLIAIREGPDWPQVVHLHATKSLWDPAFLAPGSVPTQLESISVEVTRQPIDMNTVDHIKKIWKTMLLETRYSQPGRFGKDGVAYIFSMKDPFRGIVSGEVWSPTEASRTAHLTHLAESLVKYAHRALNPSELEAVTRSVGLAIMDQH